MKIATHSGSFQADEVFALSILKLIYPDAKIVRTRDPEIYSKADMRVDVGMKYDPETNDFDHHQPEGAGEREGIPYSSCGLIWKHFGMKLVDTEEQWQRIEEKFIKFIDSIDCGVMPYTYEEVKPYTISDMVRTLNPDWQSAHDAFDPAFFEALETCKKLLSAEIHKTKGFEKAQKIVKEAIKKSDGKIIVLDTFAPWKRTVCEEAEDAMFIVYPTFKNEWGVQTIPTETSSFERKKLFPESWAGLQDEDLAKASGVEDAVFCHRGRWIAGARTKQGAIKLAKLALDA